MSQEVQNYANHAKFVPMYHFLTFGLLVVNLAWSAWQLVRAFSPGNVIALLMAFALIFLFFFARLFALARRVLEEGIPDRKTIKQNVQSWRPDHQRI